MLLREGGSSESIRTVSPADTHPRPPHTLPAPLSTHPSPVAGVRRLVRGTPTGRPTTFSAAPQFSPLFPFITARRKRWVGRPRRRERPSLFLSYPPPRPPLPPPASPFVSTPSTRGRSYDLHPSCLAELPLSLPFLTLSCPLPSPTDVREPDLLETRAASNGVFPPLLILTARPALTTVVSPIRRPSSALPRPCPRLPAGYFSSFL